MLVEGGLTGLVVVLLSYIYQLADPVPPQLSELSPQIQAWFRRGSLVDILDKKMFVLTQGQSHSHLIHIMKQWTSEIYFLYINIFKTPKSSKQAVHQSEVSPHLGFNIFSFRKRQGNNHFDSWVPHFEFWLFWRDWSALREVQSGCVWPHWIRVLRQTLQQLHLLSAGPGGTSSGAVDSSRNKVSIYHVVWYFLSSPVLFTELLT